MPSPLPIDVVIFGGGAAGLWLLDELVRSGARTLLLESHELGSGQTIASQGIIHGGLKYTLGGLLTPAARAIADMPMIWRRCLAGEARPDLSGTRLRAEYCYLWRTDSLRSRLAMIGARAGLRVKPVRIEQHERPAALAECPGIVARLDEQVIDPASFVSVLSQQHVSSILRIDAESGLEFDRAGPQAETIVRLLNPETGEPLDIRARTLVLTAGRGNAGLRRMLGLQDNTMQLRSLHMVLIRGDHLLPLHAHCVDGAATRATVTSTRDFDDRMIWQVGGQIAERGVHMDSSGLAAFARRELQTILPGLKLDALEWATHRVDRAEAATRTGSRPNEPFVMCEGNVITAWPTKLALVPEMARRTIAQLRLQDGAETVSNTAHAHSGSPARMGAGLNDDRLTHWPRPIVALPPWETQQQWFIDP